MDERVLETACCDDDEHLFNGICLTTAAAGTWATGNACEWILTVLHDHFRGLLKSREHHRIDLHLDECDDCSTAAVAVLGTTALAG